MRIRVCGTRAQPLGQAHALAAVALAFCIALVVLAQGISAPFVKDAEPQSAEFIQSVVNGRVLIPSDYYGELLRKPPLFYWLAAVVTAATGGHVDEVRARVVSAVAGAVIAVQVLLWACEFIGVTAGWLSFLFLLGSFAFASRGTLALVDMLLLMFVFGAWCLMFAALEEAPSRGRTIAIGILLGLGILTKGPIALALTAFAGLIYLVLARRPILAMVRQPWPWVVLAISVAIALPWYAAALLGSGGEFARIVFQENAGHFLPASAGGTGEAARPFYYIAVKMIGGVTPLNLLLPAALAGFCSGAFEANARKPLLFQASFLLAVLIIFSSASAKRDDYVLAGIPSLAILFAALFTSLAPSSETGARLAARLRDLAALIAAVAMVAGLVAVALWVSIGADASRLPVKLVPADRAAVEIFLGYVHDLNPGLVAAGLGVILGAALVFVGLSRRCGAAGFGLGVLSLVGVVLVTGAIRPALDRGRTLKFSAAEIAGIIDGAPLYCLESENQELSFYLGREVPGIFEHRRIRAITGKPSYLFAYASEFNGPGAALRPRVKFITGWERLGRGQAPALYQLEPDAQDLKPGRGADK